ncbi:hypothetical protein MKW98_031117 [Papaver atlanticum]|uniref:Uncharacterized protein n=1 Tax=Papaver atlanticum TaxID=357466 RepID=A0AAD4SWD6_9MAGN|nr:hypothetical protein MKW98_031117 [Papaver atlanticum]
MFLVFDTGCTWKIVHLLGIQFEGFDLKFRFEAEDMMHREVLKALFPLLDAKDLASSMQVCKQWRDTARDDYFWKFLCAKRWPSICKNPSSSPPMTYHKLYLTFSKRIQRRTLLPPRLSFDDLEFFIDIWAEEGSDYRMTIPVNPRFEIRSGQSAINQKILSLNSKDYKAEIKTADAQYSHKDGVIVLVTECLTGKDKVGRKFTVIFLAPQQKGYYVRNYAFRCLDEGQVLKPETFLVNGTSESITAALVAQKLEPSHVPDIPVPDTTTPIAEELSSGTEVHEHLNNEPIEGHSIYIKNLSMTTTKEQVEKEFKSFGPIKPGGVQVRSNKGFCFGFVEFEQLSSMQNAVKVHRGRYTELGQLSCQEQKTINAVENARSSNSPISCHKIKPTVFRCFRHASDEIFVISRALEQFVLINSNLS